MRTYAALLDRTSLAVQSDHIKSTDNDLAELLSRQNFNSHSPATRHQQIFHKEPKLASCRYFRPDLELLSHLESRLFNEPWITTTSLPRQLGQFVAVGSTISSSVSDDTLNLPDDWTLEHQSQECADHQLGLCVTHPAAGSTCTVDHSNRVRSQVTYLMLQNSLGAFEMSTHVSDQLPTRD